MLDTRPKADRASGHDAGCREALADEGIKPCSPGRKSRGTAIKHGRRRTKRRPRIEGVIGRPKGGRRVAPRLATLPRRVPPGQHLDRHQHGLPASPEPSLLPAFALWAARRRSRTGGSPT